MTEVISSIAVTTADIEHTSALFIPVFQFLKGKWSWIWGGCQTYRSLTKQMNPSALINADVPFRRFLSPKAIHAATSLLQL